MNKKVKLVIEVLAYVIIVATLVIGTPKALSYFLGTQYPVASITSGSMWPSLKKGDLVFIKKVDKSELEIGDIIVYKNERGFTIHRIIELKEDTLRTRGDANNVSDQPIEYENIIGRTVSWGEKPFKIPYLGKLTIWASELRK
jgi:signal peptidase